MLQSWFGKEASRNLAIAVIMMLTGAIAAIWLSYEKRFEQCEAREKSCYLEIQSIRAEERVRYLEFERQVRARQMQIDSIMFTALRSAKKK